ncbi:hypothetical protein [Microbacterium kyungheense]|uniref:Uncharacterized protein n=1 Tax=Microbacterium kyungheense TaxID=1263636 RepID=A0A543FJZ6_9MICO|nr:hypothetical protein [Microbacterium kyungheense]TQM34135.1 hypothetical protein FB391_0422 [Microbacterium kyungheense]
MAGGHDWDDMSDTPGDVAPADVVPADAAGIAGEDLDAAHLGAADADSDGFDGGYPFANVFTEEIENVSVSDWDVDADALWGDRPDLYELGGEPDATAFDLPA